MVFHIRARCLAATSRFVKVRRSPAVRYTHPMSTPNKDLYTLQPTDVKAPEDPEELWAMIQARYDSAQAGRAATMTETSLQLIEEFGFTFILKISANLAQKPKPKPANRPSAGDLKIRNPFLPPEPELFVCHLSSTHSLVLNKYNIVPHHSLIITRAFEPQESSLTAADFESTMKVVNAMPLPHGGLAFFNCGPQSGASQPHKHLQVIPLPLVSNSKGTDGIPFEHVIGETLAEQPALSVRSVPSLPFINFVTRINGQGTSLAIQLAETHAKMVHRAMKEVLGGQFIACTGPAIDYQLSFNTLFTKDFMMLIPRRLESYSAVSCNAMAFAGSFFVRNAEELNAIRGSGPLHILSEVGFPKMIV